MTPVIFKKQSGVINVHEETESDATLQVIHVCRNPKRSLMLFSETAVKALKLQRGRKSTFPEGQKERNQGIHDDISLVEHSGVSLSPSQYHLPSICTWMRTHIYIRSLPHSNIISARSGRAFDDKKVRKEPFFFFFLYSSAPPGLVFIFLLCYQSQKPKERKTYTS